MICLSLFIGIWPVTGLDRTHTPSHHSSFQRSPENNITLVYHTLIFYFHLSLSVGIFSHVNPVASSTWPVAGVDRTFTPSHYASLQRSPGNDRTVDWRGQHCRYHDGSDLHLVYRLHASSTHRWLSLKGRHVTACIDRYLLQKHSFTFSYTERKKNR